MLVPKHFLKRKLLPSHPTSGIEDRMSRCIYHSMPSLSYGWPHGALHLAFPQTIMTWQLKPEQQLMPLPEFTALDILSDHPLESYVSSGLNTLFPSELYLILYGRCCRRRIWWLGSWCGRYTLCLHHWIETRSEFMERIFTAPKWNQTDWNWDLDGNQATGFWHLEWHEKE